MPKLTVEIVTAALSECGLVYEDVPGVPRIGINGDEVCTEEVRALCSLLNGALEAATPAPVSGGEGADLASALWETAQRLEGLFDGKFAEWHDRARDCRRAADLIRKLAAIAERSSDEPKLKGTHRP